MANREERAALLPGDGAVVKAATRRRSRGAPLAAAACMLALGAVATMRTGGGGAPSLLSSLDARSSAAPGRTVLPSSSSLDVDARSTSPDRTILPALPRSRNVTGALPRLGVNGSLVSVSGLSSGADMAVQLHVAHSSRVMGAAIFAGEPYVSSAAPAVCHARAARMRRRTLGQRAADV